MRSPAEGVAFLTECSAADSGRRWPEASRAVQETVKAHPGHGVALLQAIVADPDGDPDVAQDVAKTILGAWADELPPDLQEEMMALLPKIWETGTTRWMTGTEDTGDGEWLFRAINNWAGRAAQVTLRLVSAQMQQTMDSRAELPCRLGAVLDKMLAGVDRASAYAQVVIASQIYLLFTADRPWCLHKVLPLLDPNNGNENGALRCWDGYLTWGRSDQNLLRAGLLDMYMRMGQLVDRMTPEQSRHFYRHLADVSVLSGINPLDSGWLNRFTADATPGGRTQWIDWVTHRLRRILLWKRPKLIGRPGFGHTGITGCGAYPSR